MYFITTALANHNVVPLVWNIYLREISTGEMNDLHWLLDNDAESGYRAKMILLRDEGYTVPEIRRITNHHDNNIRKWIHRFKYTQYLRDKKNYNSSYDNNIRKWIYRFNEKVLMVLYLENMYEMLTRLQKT